MKCFDINLNTVLKINLFDKETLIPPRLHVSRTVTEYIIYVIVAGELHLVQNGDELVLTAGDVFFFDRRDGQVCRYCCLGSTDALCISVCAEILYQGRHDRRC